jgi:ribosomal protein L22
MLLAFIAARYRPNNFIAYHSHPRQLGGCEQFRPIAMSLSLRSRRLLAPGKINCPDIIDVSELNHSPTAASTQASILRLSFLVPYLQRRTFFWSRKGNDFEAPRENPLTEEYLKRKPSKQKGLVLGDLASSSIFEDEKIAGPKPAPLQSDKRIGVRDPAIMAAALDPDPTSRVRWERKMVIREIHKRGRLSRTQLIKRQERELLSKSHNIKTSLKKLGPLARQIAGKSVEEAIVQMRFSKKKAAIDVRKHLEHARNEAIVRRGMGLRALEGRKAPPTVIKRKDGKRIKVDDPTALYVDQAWVGKGDYGITPEYRARGQINFMHNPTTRKLFSI